MEQLLDKLLRGAVPARGELAAAIAAEDFAAVYAAADECRRRTVGDIVHLRAIIEFSNHCRRRCRYCGLNAENPDVRRFRMTPEEIVRTAREAADAGYRTVVLQSGEDNWFTPQILGDVVKRIREETGLVITLSCGEMPEEDYAYLKQCGADRYLLKHETADPELYAALHPCGTLENRVRCLRSLKRLGYETGSGFMIGLPGQTADTVAADLLLLRSIGCDMAGIGPFIPHPGTSLGGEAAGSTELTKRAVALARLLLPKCNLPATTSLGVLDSSEKNDIFSCGANVVMRKVTPPEYRKFYEIYPADFGAIKSVAQERAELEDMIRKLGRVPR